jgi:hypothetical protein
MRYSCAAVARRRDRLGCQPRRHLRRTHASPAARVAAAADGPTLAGPRRAARGSSHALATIGVDEVIRRITIATHLEARALLEVKHG